MELVDLNRACALERAPNTVVRRRRDGRILQINLLSFSDDHNRRRRGGNPQSLIHDHESDTNPPRVWELKRA